MDRALKKYEQFIGGAWRGPHSGQWIDTVDPADGRVWARIPRGGAEDAAAAVEAAHQALINGPWAGASPAVRKKALLNLAAVLRERWEDLVEPEVRDNGKRVTEVRAQISGLHTWYEHFAGQTETLHRAPLNSAYPGADTYLSYEPCGVIAAITPWNSPLLIAAWKAAPALAGGNTVVIKPSEMASASTLEFARLAADSGLPAGAINVTTGFGHEAGEALVRHPLTAKVSFTGSGAGGQKAAGAAAAGVKPVTLELGGKSPQIVFPDADMENAVNGVLSGIFLSNGQTCVAGSRLIVHSSVHDAFTARLVERAAALRAGHPMDPETEIGPLANRPHLEKVLAMLEEAKKSGATCACGGEQIKPSSAPDGFFVSPAVFTGVTPDMALWREEVFGPVLAVTPFETEEDAVTLANNTDYGLAAGVWTSDAACARRMAEVIAAGTVYINHYRSVDVSAPIGGYKLSGYGRELGPDAVKDFMQVKAVWEGTAPMTDPFPENRSPI